MIPINSPSVLSVFCNEQCFQTCTSRNRPFEIIFSFIHRKFFVDKFKRLITIFIIVNIRKCRYFPGNAFFCRMAGQPIGDVSSRNQAFEFPILINRNLGELYFQTSPSRQQLMDPPLAMYALYSRIEHQQ